MSFVATVFLKRLTADLNSSSNLSKCQTFQSIIMQLLPIIAILAVGSSAAEMRACSRPNMGGSCSVRVSILCSLPLKILTII